jgi:hypothetical protein
MITKLKNQNKYVREHFDDENLNSFIKEYKDRRNLPLYDDGSSMFNSTLRTSNRSGTFFSAERENRDLRYLQNYEKQKKRWQRYAKMISK